MAPEWFHPVSLRINKGLQKGAPRKLLYQVRVVSPCQPDGDRPKNYTLGAGFGTGGTGGVEGSVGVPNSILIPVAKEVVTFTT